MESAYSQHIFDDITFEVPKNYTDLKPIGCGGQGFVCSAFDTSANQAVAIKKLQRTCQTIDCIKRAFREVKLMKMVSHKNIMGLINTFTPQTLENFMDVYLVMELMDHDLGKLQNLDHNQIRFYMYQILCGVNYLHESGIIHRDLKPSNIAINSNGRLKILDFGLARTVDKNCMTKHVVTRYYRAPEVIFGMGYDKKVDSWSIGCIMGELMTSSYLFPGKNDYDQWNKITEKLGTPSSTFIERLLPNIQDYVKKLPTRQNVLFDELFPNEPVPSPAKELLSSLLVIDPIERISVEDALLHPYFEPVNSDRDNTPILPCLVDEGSRSLAEWKKMLYEELQ